MQHHHAKLSTRFLAAPVHQSAASAGIHLSSPVQIVSKEGTSGLDRLRAEYVVRIQGQLRKRLDPNPNIPTGMVELVAEQVMYTHPHPKMCRCTIPMT